MEEWCMCPVRESFGKEATVFGFSRQHVFELVEGAAWKSVFDTSMSPDHAEFKQFQERWLTLKNGKDQFKNLRIKNRKLISLKEETVSFLKIVLNEEKNLLLQGDYRECVEIILLLLVDPAPRR
ncbi:hypothetical protein AVEN_22774-1 [Araneus ventricosus]|uniref:Uncharacterized protein n=1 Tax=Araneus ventricosus TaxID=182803 RepID=A0A4Y2EAL5_ARAVE|nr:hypothetical protein AVEN_22774-1 [Araneus ventricosus]